MLNQRTAEVASLLKPTRLNFAGMCIYCETFGCVSDRCQATHAASVWGICPECDGTGTPLDDDLGRCGCAYGVTQFGSVKNQSAETHSSVVPVSVPPALLSVPLPRCLGCGHRTASLHEDCVSDINPGSWVPCGCCQGLRIDADGFECRECCGAGFIPMTGHDTLAERAGDVTPW
ncbi:hypothetical protein ACFQZ4_53090 [Catellatospora coxensis]|uniref:Uncharacterized protein n=1 Tax=Catellatospora coxensis TaxID=310354 RepID=A0A8J3PC23_9ACTN|nr:hypothetical protein [Catellatospora coxensis]GIG11552.1 hypothetical protein Cco03nite_82520 [Catellatospora coxensis]